MTGNSIVIVDGPKSYLIVEDEELGTTVVIDSPPAPVLQVFAAGLQGPPGADGTGAPTRIDFSSGATWTSTHSFGRVPMILVFLSDGTQIIADITATAFNFTVTHAFAQSGFVLLF